MSEEDKPKFNLHIKKSLTLKQGAPIPGQLGMRGIFKDHRNFPKGTKYKWLLPPDTSQNRYTNAKVQIIFPDGTIRQHTVHYQIYVPGKPINQPKKKKKATPKVAKTVKTPQKLLTPTKPQQKKTVAKTERAVGQKQVNAESKKSKWLFVVTIAVVVLLVLALFLK